MLHCTLLLSSGAWHVVMLNTFSSSFLIKTIIIHTYEILYDGLIYGALLFWDLSFFFYMYVRSCVMCVSMPSLFHITMLSTSPTFHFSSMYIITLHYVQASLFKIAHLLLDTHSEYILFPPHPLAIYNKKLEVRRLIKKTDAFSLIYRGLRNVFCFG
jgi:hypothetical protein